MFHRSVRSGKCSTAQNMTVFLSISSGDKQRKVIHRDVASISKTKSFTADLLCSEKVG